MGFSGHVNKIDSEDYTNTIKRLFSELHELIEQINRVITLKIKKKTPKKSKLKNKIETELSHLRNSLMKKVPEELFWCPCKKAPEDTRKQFIIELIQTIIQKHPSLKKPLVYTSVASGGFLQDYLTLKILLDLGYENLRVNLIDPLYKDATANSSAASDILLKSLTIDHPKSLAIKKYETIYDYLQQRDSLHKSNVIVMVDTEDFRKIFPPSMKPGEDKLEGNFFANMIIFMFPGVNLKQFPALKLTMPYQQKAPFLNGTAYINQAYKESIDRKKLEKDLKDTSKKIKEESSLFLIDSGELFRKNYPFNHSYLLFGQKFSLTLMQLAQAEIKHDGEEPIVFELNQNTITHWQPIDGSFLRSFEKREAKEFGDFITQTINPDGSLS